MVDGDGEQTRDFVYVTDLANGLIRAMEADGVGGEVFQLASGVETSLNTLISLLVEISGCEPRGAARAPAAWGDPAELLPRREGEAPTRLRAGRKA